MIPIEDHKRSNKRKTWLLFAGFFLLIGAILYLLIEMTGGDIFILAFFAILSIIMFSTIYFQGHNIIAKMAGAKKVTAEGETYLWHTVEGLSIAAGIKMPKPYIIETQTPNAFAAGRSPEHAIVAVTRGLLNKLDRSELEAVVAHEIAHVKNYDIMVATLSVVMAGVVSIMAVMLRRSYFFGGARRRSSKDNKGGGIIMLVAILVGILAPIFAKIVQFAISREREYLADATAADLTGYPEALASALEKISGMNQGDEKLSENEMMQGLYIINPLSSNARGQGRAAKLFSTHPDIRERVKRLRSM